jgi:hypothetical protein
VAIRPAADPNAQNVDSSAIQQQCKTGADANKYAECRIVGTVNSAKSFWSAGIAPLRQAVPRARDDHLQRRHPVRLRHGLQPGRPVLLPARREDLHRRELLRDPHPAASAPSDGALAQEYVVAHEYGHHIQNILGLLGRAQQDPQGETSGAVRIELMADCFGGMWAAHASQTKDATGTTYLKPLTETGHPRRPLGRQVRR